MMALYGIFGFIYYYSIRDWTEENIDFKYWNIYGIKPENQEYIVKGGIREFYYYPERDTGLSLVIRFFHKYDDLFGNFKSGQSEDLLLLSREKEFREMIDEVIGLDSKFFSSLKIIDSKSHTRRGGSVTLSIKIKDTYKMFPEEFHQTLIDKRENLLSYLRKKKGAIRQQNGVV